MSARRKPRAATLPLDEIPLRQRVASVRYDINWQGTAVRVQYECLAAHLELTIDERIYSHMRGIVDFDFLVMSVHRLPHVAERARALGCDTSGELTLAIRVFTSRTRPRFVLPGEAEK